MKRLRDDAIRNPQFKRSCGPSLGESYLQRQGPSINGGGGGGGGGGAGAGGNAQRLTTNDALTYLKEVKDMFQDQKGKYETFLDVMKDFKAQRIDTAGVIARVKELFKGHINLILGFNTFLPKGYEITLNEEEDALPKRTVEFEEAISFVNKIKKRFQNDDHIYKSFLDILNMYRKEHKGITEVYKEVALLFEEHQDLQEEFSRFLPDTSASASVPHASFGRHSFQRYDERSSVMPNLRQAQIDKPRFQRDTIVSPSGGRNTNVQRPDMDDDKTMLRLNKEQNKHAETENRERRNHDQDYREPENDNYGDSYMHSLAEKRKSARKVEGFGGNNVSTSYEDKDALKSMYSQEFSFCERVKERLRNPDDYQAFLKCLNIYSTEIITRKELQELVADLLRKYPDLIEGFNEFLERCEKIDGFLGVMSKKSLWNEGYGSKPLKLEEKDKEQKCDMEDAKEKDRYKEKYWGKSIQELDLSNCEQCTPSYRCLPEHYPIPSVSQRSELGDKVLNDYWVSVTSGSEDYSFKHMRRNQYEESLFRCEDDRFELDMLLELVNSTAKRAEELLNTINGVSGGVYNQICVEDHFTALNIRCIERLYGEHGLDVMEILRKSPALALPIMLTRLKQKQDEWTKCRSDFNGVWAEIYAKNHYKSLDHRSFYFKQQDSKNLSTKSLVAEIKEIKEKMQKEDDVPLSFAAGSRHRVVPNLEFLYADVEIHEDLYKLIKYSCEEICSTKEQIYKIMQLWTAFLEPMLGVPSWSHGSDSKEDDVLSKHRASKFTGASVFDSDRSHSVDATLTMNSMQFKAICNDSSEQQLNSCRSNLANTSAWTKDDATDYCDRLTNSDAVIVGAESLPSGRGEMSSSPGNVGNTDDHGAKSNGGDIPLSEGGDVSRSIQLSDGGFAEGSRVNGHNRIAPKNEKEEGELSPIGDSEEDNFAGIRDTSSQPNANHGDESLQCQNGGGEEVCCQDAAGDSDADDEDSENVSEVGGDVSGSESAADECSRENEEDDDGERDELDGQGDSEGEAEGISEAHCEGGDGTSSSVSEPFQTCKPLTKQGFSSVGKNSKQRPMIFYSNDSFYVLFRLHQVLYERLLSAKKYCASSDLKWRNTKDADTDPYCRFMSALHALLDGASDNTKFEDDCRSIIGNQSYVLFTLDKLIYKLVKQLQAISSDELDNKLLQLYEYEKSRRPEKYIDSVYYENSHVLLHEENIYRFESTSSPTCLSIQLMDDGNEKSEVVAVLDDPKFADYLYNYYLQVRSEIRESSAVMLKRNKRKYQKIDEDTAFCMAMENVSVWNGLECKMASSSSKIFYVLDTEDFFFHLRRKRKRTARDEDFHRSRVVKFIQYWKALLQSRT